MMYIRKLASKHPLPAYLMYKICHAITGAFFSKVKNKPWIPWVYTWSWHRCEQLTNVHFRLQQTNGSLPFPVPSCRKKRKLPFSVSSIFHLRNSGNVETWTWRHGDGDMETWRCRDIETWRHGDKVTWRHGDVEMWRRRVIEMETSNRKWKPSQFSLIRLPFAHCANRILSFVCLLLKKQIEVNHLQMD